MAGRGSWWQKYTPEERKAHMARLWERQSDPARRHRSRITSRKNLAIAVVDGRTTWGRRYSDLVTIYETDLGGYDECTAGERAVIRRVASLQSELERYDRIFSTKEEATPDQLALYGATADRLRRLLESIGFRQRRARDITPLAERLAVPIDDYEPACVIDGRPKAAPESAAADVGADPC
jgi:hypothetical protein